MRYASICGAMLLALGVLIPGEVLAKGPSGSDSGSGGKGYSGNKGSSGSNWNRNSNWNKNWNNNWWYPRHRDYYYNYYSEPVYAEPFYEEPVYSGLPIKIVNPAGSGVTLTYSLNGQIFRIPPGYSQKLIEDRDWVIEFSRGQGFGGAEYSLQPGVFTFGYSNRGWDLFRGSRTSVAGPTNPAPTEAAPVNPPPKTARVPTPIE